mmetsp:Transcript_23981/g.66571  ORF Transcript_23981/g.66571 Transcript_23981/m.66571 type:complete len:223 (-) Transcript_23981:1427-2095(-)|eukprot:CAMPEP_0168747810 /NCGR_PEP_ID=MMETSP0724-20121128/15849_1 /TAXON_ID=265536 /ORGANISM="Amphiprora sp., Strain CCMP467" /LENGTH=222 /DNA_ID=CAMNT_0008795613 /DNA_START=94 /DNA_END=762 /DNA_ORIENTATION=+
MFEFLTRLWEALFQSLGLGGKQGNLFLLGLDNAGKTTLLHRLRTGSLPQTFPPTDRPSQNVLQIGRIQFQAWDMGGHEAVRHMWSEYLLGSGNEQSKKIAILFLIDAADPERIEEAGYELDSLLLNDIKKENGSSVINDGDANDNLQDDDDDKDESSMPPVALLLNKCDLAEQALPTAEILERIDYSHLAQNYSPDRLAIFRISTLRGEGYQDAFTWISTFL